MRKREIHSVAHWAMMFLLLMFPLLMVGISTFGKEENNVEFEYQYQTNEVTSVSDLVIGNIYTFTYDGVTTQSARLGISYLVFDSADIVNYDFKAIGTTYDLTIRINYNYNGTDYNTFAITVDNSTSNMFTTVNTFDFVYGNSLYNTNSEYIVGMISACQNIPYTDATITQTSYKTDVNNWITAFLDLPINSWYQSLMNVIGVGFTNSTVMNVIYVMPVYILWVFIFDVIVDCFLVIIKLPHKLLNRLSGGENE